MRGRVFVVLAIVAFALGGCTSPWWSSPKEDDGIIRIVVNPGETESMSAEPKLIPADADSVRIRVWHPISGYNTVATVSLNGTSEGVDIHVPQDTGYVVDVVSYVLRDGRALALTGGRARNVDVEAKVITTVAVALQTWETESAGDESTEPEDTYTVGFTLTDGGGLLTEQTFNGATLHTSVDDFQNSSDSLPLFPGSAGIQEINRFTFSGVAPAVTEETTLYMCGLVQFTQNWKDTSLADRDEHVLYIEIPNRHMDEDLYELTVDPSAGGLVVEISDL